MMWRMWTLFETHGKIFGWVKLKMRWKKKKWLQGSDGGPLLSKGAKSYSNRSSFHQGSLYYQPKKGSIVGEIPQNYPYLIHLHCLIPPKIVGNWMTPSFRTLELSLFVSPFHRQAANMPRWWNYVKIQVVEVMGCSEGHCLVLFNNNRFLASQNMNLLVFGCHQLMACQSLKTSYFRVKYVLIIYPFKGLFGC